MLNSSKGISKGGEELFSPQKNPTEGWIKLILSILMIFLFIKLVSFAEYLPGIKRDFKAIRDSGIQTGFFWWADVHEVAEAEKHFKRLHLINATHYELQKKGLVNRENQKN